jgi:asparagine synthetase B (glutamine-hydrolysing)
MTLLAEHTSEGGTAPGVVLHAPEAGAWRRVGSDGLLLGFPVTRDGEALGGSWTQLAREGDELAISSDRFGTRPLYMRTVGGRTLVADDIWSLLDPCPALDPLGVADFLLVGYGLGRRTIFEGVSSTQADGKIRVGRSGTQIDFNPLPEPAAIAPTLDAAVDALDAELGRLLDPYGDLGRLLVPLSGGLDSRVVLAAAVDAGLDVHAWTFVARDGTAEERLAADVARTLSVPHTISRATDAGFADVDQFVRASSGQLSLEHMHGYGAHREAPSEYAIEANGVWGDILCGGSRLPPAGTPAAAIEQHHARSLVQGRDPNALQRHLPGVPDWEPRLRELVTRWWEDVDRDPRRADLMWARNRTARFNVHSLIAAMRDGLDYITPFLDDSMMRTCYGVGERWQRDSLAYRRAICRRWPALGRIPWQKTGLPVNRYPARRHAAMRRLRGAVGLGPASTAFTDQAVYEQAFDDLIAEAVAELSAVLDAIGIDLRRLLAAYPRETGHGGALRLRVATLAVALRGASGSGSTPEREVIAA